MSETTCDREPPRHPAHLDALAEVCLKALSESGLGQVVSIGGTAGLLHCCDYRSTHHLDAWWDESASPEEQRRVVAVIEQALQPFGRTRVRSWGDVVSVEMLPEGRVVFSFQVARRAARLAPSLPAPGTGVLLDSLDDLLASKMVALVERGAPRDLRDIHAVCAAGLSTARECWDLWRRRQQLAGSDTEPERARLAIETHLARIAQHRPLERIADPGQRAEAEEVRTWFAKEFLNAIE